MVVHGTVIFNGILLCIYLIFSIYWVMVFIRRIINCRKYKRGAARCITDEESGYLNNQLCYHYETEIWKYVYLLVIILLELLSCILLFVTKIFGHYGAPDQRSILPFTLGECNLNTTLNHSQNIETLLWFYYFIHGLANIAELLWITVSVCLMNYLVIRVKKIKYHKTSHPRYLLITSALISLFILITNPVQKLRIINLITFNIITVIFFWIFVKSSKKLKRALLQISLERLTQFGSNKEEMKQYEHFRYTINLICCTVLFIIIGERVVVIPPMFIGPLINRNCYFPFNLFPQFSFTKRPEKFVEIVSKVSTCVMASGANFCYMGIILCLTPFILITIRIWIKHILVYVRGTPVIKYTQL